MSAGHVALLVVGTAFGVVGIAWVVRTARKLRRRENAPRILWLLVIERGAAWIVVGLAFAFGALGSASVGRWFFLGGCALVVVEAVVWRALLPRMVAGLDLDDLR
jgi:Kef-type K+ transport system membrane component KefB